MFKNIECRRVAPLLWEYVSRNLPMDEAKRVTAHVERCAACRHEVEGYRQAVDQVVAYRANEMPESSTSWSALRARIELESRRGQDARFRPNMRLVWAPAAAVALVILSLVAFRSGQRRETRRPEVARVQSPGAEPSNTGMVQVPDPHKTGNIGMTQLANRPVIKERVEIPSTERPRRPVNKPDRMLVHNDARPPVRRTPDVTILTKRTDTEPRRLGALAMADGRAPGSERTHRNYVIAAAPPPGDAEIDAAYVMDTLPASQPSVAAASGLDGAIEDTP
jgi:hypothetical protein